MNSEPRSMSVVRRSLHSAMFRLISVLLIFAVVVADDEYSPRTKRAAPLPAGTKLRVVTILSEPYTMMSDSKHKDNYQGFRGFVPDIVREIERRINANVTLYLVPDGKYGAKDRNNKWNGMIGEILKKQNGDETGADLAAADLTTTSMREAHIDYIKPFQHLGLVMMVKKPSLQDADKGLWDYTFDVIRPLAPEVWVICSIGVLVVGLILWANNRYNPYEWGGRYNLGRASESAAETFGLTGSLWYAFSTLQWQGFDRSPRSISSRVLSAFWFAFVTLTLLTYTGSLVNHLFWASTVHGKDPLQHPIRNLKDMVYDSSYDYGVVKGGSSYNYFLNVADGPVYDKMREYWASNQGRTSLVRSTSEGVRRLRASRDGKFVFIAEKTFAEYTASRKPCDIMTVGPVLAPRSYSMAVSHSIDKAVSEALHTATLDMIAEGDMDALENKWWHDMGECSEVKSEEELRSKMSALYVNKPKKVTLTMFWGPLVLLLVGIVLAVLLAIGEVVYFKMKGRHEAVNQPGSGKFGIEEDT